MLVTESARFADGEFDVVVAYGGPLSYAFEQVDEALTGLFRIVRPGGMVVASVMSLLGTWRPSPCWRSTYLPDVSLARHHRTYPTMWGQSVGNECEQLGIP